MPLSSAVFPQIRRFTGCVLGGVSANAISWSRFLAAGVSMIGWSSASGSRRPTDGDGSAKGSEPPPRAHAAGDCPTVSSTGGCSMSGSMSIRRSSSSPLMTPREQMQRRSVGEGCTNNAERQRKYMEMTIMRNRSTHMAHARTVQSGVNHGKLERSNTLCLRHAHSPPTAKPRQPQTMQSKHT